MLLLAIDSILILFITLSLGIITLVLLGKFFKCPVEANILGTLLAGFVLSDFYFNMVSIWLPVNFYSLVPLLIASVSVILSYKKHCAFLLQNMRQNVMLIFSKRNLFLTIPILILLFYYCIIPPINTDSADYHYATIRWYESYPAIPGLGNIHGRYAFNSAAFIIQAAYSFTAITGQPVYPLNSVLTSLCLLWIFTRALKNAQTLLGLVYVSLFVMLTRVLLLNMSSPSADPLFIACLVYIYIKVYDAVINKTSNLPHLLLPAILLLYSITAKLAAIPSLLLIPLLLYLLRKTNLLPLVLKFIGAGLLIYVPWLCRNVILSGYLIYPVYQLDIFAVDWKIPKNILLLEAGYVKGLAALFSSDIGYVKTLSFPLFLYKWFKAQFYTGHILNFIIFIPAMLSPLYWLAGLKHKSSIPRLAFMLWLISYAGVWMWLYLSPEYRFGITFLAFSTVLPWLAMKDCLLVKKIAVARSALTATIFICTVLYLIDGYRKPFNYPYSIKDFWLLPLKDKQYLSRRDSATFKYTTLANGVKVYIPDADHACLNAPQLPCIQMNYGSKIIARGPAIENGFITVSDSIPVLYPWVK